MTQRIVYWMHLGMIAPTPRTAMPNPKIFLTLSALLSASLSLPAQDLSFFEVDLGGGVMSGWPDDGINDQAAFMYAQTIFPGQLGNGTLTLQDGEYIVGDQQFNQLLFDPNATWPPDGLNWIEWNYPSGSNPISCPAMAAARNVFWLKDCSNFTIQGVPPTPGVPGTGTRIRFRDCLYYGTFYRPAEDEIFSAVGSPCETCTQDPHSPDLLHAAVGAMFTFRNCRDITIRDLELNGNTDHAILGGRGNFDGNQTPYDGIALEHSSHTLIDNVHAHHFGRDGLYIGEALVPAFPNPITQTALDQFQLAHPGPDLDYIDQTLYFVNRVENSQFNWNGRQGISWTACSGLTVEYCDMNYTGAGRVSSRPSAGLDIEGGGGPFRVRDGDFNFCNFLHNRGRGIHSDAGDCIGQQDFRFADCIVKAGTEGDAVLPNTRKMEFIDCKIFGNVGPFYEQAERKNDPWDPSLNLVFRHTEFYEEDNEWSYIKWFAENTSGCGAGPHMFRFTENRAGPVLFDNCSFNTNCKATVRLMGAWMGKGDFPWCQTCSDCGVTPNTCAPTTCLTQGPCDTNCGDVDAHYVTLIDCKFQNTGREKCATHTQVLAIERTITLAVNNPVGIEIKVPAAVRPPSSAGDYYFDLNQFPNDLGPECDNNGLCNSYSNPPIYTTDPYPPCLPFYAPPDITWANCGSQNLWTQSCTEGGCVADLMIPSGTLSSTLSSPVSGTVSIQGQFIVDQDFTFDGADVKMGPAAEIIVQPGIDLFVLNSTFESCLGMMWKGITARDGGIVMVNNSRIADAETGITGLNGSILLLDGSEFGNNRVAVGVPYQGQFNNVVIYAGYCTFHTDGPLPSPYPGQTTTLGQLGYAALHVHDMALEFTGINNIIRDLSNGIVASGSTVNVSGCRFQNIQPDVAYASEWNGAGIYARGGGGYYQLNQTGYGMGSLPSFENCSWGVFTHYMNVKSTENTMLGMGTAYRVDHSDFMHVNILDNEVHTLFHGIDLRFNDGAQQVLVQGNDITFGAFDCSSGCPSYSGINVAEGNIPALSSMIQGNTIRFTEQFPSRYGIKLLAANSWVVAGNTLLMENNTSNLYGVLLDGCTRTEVSCNTITSVFNTWINDRQAAIRNFMGSDPLISCNDMDRTTNGILFNGVADGTNVRGNHIRSHKWGLRLGPTAIIGVQDARGNLWHNAVPDGGEGAWYQVDDIQASPYRFFVNPATINAVPPSWEPPNWFQLTFDPNYNCDDDEGEEYCSQFRVRGSERLTELDERVANDSLENDPYTDETKWILKGNLYKKLDENPELQDSLQIMADFFDELQGSTTAAFKAIDDGQFVLYDLDGSVMEQLQSNSAEIDSLRTIVQEGLEQLGDSTLTSAQRVSILSSLSGYRQDITDLSTDNSIAMHDVDAEKALTAGNLQTANAAVSAGETIESNQKTVNDIYLATIGKNVDVFSTTQADALFDIANQCPMIGGNAVFRARSLYGLIDDTQQFDDLLLCLPFGIEVKSLREQPTAVIVSVVPNPASDDATLVLTQALEATGTLILYDAIGAEVARSLVPKGLVRIAFSTATFAPAMYHFKVLGTDSVIGMGKLTIVR